MGRATLTVSLGIKGDSISTPHQVRDKCITRQREGIVVLNLSSRCLFICFLGDLMIRNLSTKDDMEYTVDLHPKKNTYINKIKLTVKRKCHKA